MSDNKHNNMNRCRDCTYYKSQLIDSSAGHPKGLLEQCTNNEMQIVELAPNEIQCLVDNEAFIVTTDVCEPEPVKYYGREVPPIESKYLSIEQKDVSQSLELILNDYQNTLKEILGCSKYLNLMNLFNQKTDYTQIPVYPNIATDIISAIQELIKPTIENVRQDTARGLERLKKDIMITVSKYVKSAINTVKEDMREECKKMIKAALSANSTDE